MALGKMLVSRRTCFCLSVFSALLPVATASDRISWPTVAIAWAFSLLTTFFVIGITLLILNVVRKQRKKRRATAPPRIARELSVPESEASDVTRVSLVSGQPYYNNGGYRRVPSRESTANRRKSDFISAWCGQHNLSEVIAANLRENGFNSREQLESLQPQDVMTLGLPNLAQQVQLRGVLEKIHTLQAEAVKGEPRSLNVAAMSRQISGATDRSRPRSRSSTTTADDSGTSLMTTPSPKQMSLPTGTTTSFPYERRGLSPTSEEPLPCHSLSLVPGRTTTGKLMFHGLLSDAGLYELAENLGAEWRHLATHLGVSKPKQEHLASNYPGNTQQQIYEMLRHWRENETGGKEQVKAALSKAFQKIRRKDLSDKILREQVHGSDEHLTQRMNSVV